MEELKIVNHKDKISDLMKEMKELLFEENKEGNSVLEPDITEDKINNFSNLVVDTIVEDLSKKGININTEEYRQMLFKHIKTSNMLMTLLPLFC